MSGKDWTIEEKGEGGFIELKPNGFLLLSWWALNEKLIRKLDFRTLWGCSELVKRHTEGKPAKYTYEELGLIVRCRGKDDLRDSVKRLCRLGFLSWSESAVTITTQVAQLNQNELAKNHPDLPKKLLRYKTTVNKVHQSRRDVKIRVPRRAIRFIASGAKTSLIAVMLGCFMRCLFVDKRTNEIRPRGRCPLDWLHEVFGFCLKSLKAARTELLAMEWLTDLEGDWISVNLLWNGGTVDTSADEFSTGATQSVPERPIPDEFSCPERPIPDKFSPPSIYINQHPLQERRQDNQHPAAGGPADGAFQPKRAGQGTRRFWVEDHDLNSIQRLTVLFTIAQELGWVGQGEMAFLEFVALAERARTYGTQNKGGMFYRLIRTRNSRVFITQEQEDRARGLIHEYRDQRQPPPKPKPLERAEPRLSRDAQIVQAVTEKLAGAGFPGDIFTELNRQCPDWTRERWDTASIELERFQLAHKQRALGQRVERDCDGRRDAGSLACAA